MRASRVRSPHADGDMKRFSGEGRNYSGCWRSGIIEKERLSGRETVFPHGPPVCRRRVRIPSRGLPTVQHDPAGGSGRLPDMRKGLRRTGGDLRCVRWIHRRGARKTERPGSREDAVVGPRDLRVEGEGTRREGLPRFLRCRPPRTPGERGSFGGAARHREKGSPPRPRHTERTARDGCRVPEAWRGKGFDVTSVERILTEDFPHFRERTARLIRAQVMKNAESGKYRCPLCEVAVDRTAEECGYCGARFA